MDIECPVQQHMIYIAFQRCAREVVHFSGLYQPGLLLSGLCFVVTLYRDWGFLLPNKVLPWMTALRTLM